MKNINNNDEFIFLNVNGHDEPIFFNSNYFKDLVFHGAIETSNRVIINCEKVDKYEGCVRCGSPRIVRSTIKNKKIRHVNFKSKKTFLSIRQAQYSCRDCKRVFLSESKFKENNTNITKQFADKILLDFLSFNRRQATKINKIHHKALYSILQNRGHTLVFEKIDSDDGSIYGTANAAKFIDIPLHEFKRLINSGVIEKEKQYKFDKKKLKSIKVLVENIKKA